MTQIRCTQKLLKEMGNKDGELLAIAENAPAFIWYANFFKIGRYKYLVFMDEETLFSFIVPKVKKSDLANLESLFICGLENALKINKIGVIQTENMLSKTAGAFELTKTNSRVRLGNLNRIIFEYEWLIYDTNHDYNEAMRCANTTPQRTIKFHNSNEAVSNTYIDI